MLLLKLLLILLLLILLLLILLLLVLLLLLLLLCNYGIKALRKALCLVLCLHLPLRHALHVCSDVAQALRRGRLSTGCKPSGISCAAGGRGGCRRLWAGAGRGQKVSHGCVAKGHTDKR